MRPGKHTLTICDFTGKKLVEDYEFTVLGPGPDIKIEGISDFSMSFDTEISALEMVLNMNTTWVTNIPCRVEFYQQGDLKFQAHSNIDGIYQTDKEVILRLPVPNEQMLAPGEYDVAVFDSNYNHPLHSAPLKVTVPQCPVLNISFKQQLYECQTGDIFPIDYEIYPSWLTDSQLNWESSSPGIASVDSTGTVTALAPGETDITAIHTDMWVMGSCHIIVSGENSIDEIKESAINITVENSKVVVRNASACSILRIYAIDGTRVYTGPCERIPLHKGVYIITIDNIVRKIVI